MSQTPVTYLPTRKCHQIQIVWGAIQSLISKTLATIILACHYCRFHAYATSTTLQVIKPFPLTLVRTELAVAECVLSFHLQAREPTQQSTANHALLPALYRTEYFLQVVGLAQVSVGIVVAGFPVLR